MAAALGPIGSTGNTTLADGVAGSKLEPNWIGAELRAVGQRVDQQVHRLDAQAVRVRMPSSILSRR
jgi:hypothetical protein